MDSLELDVHAAITDLIEWWFHIDCFLVQIKKRERMLFLSHLPRCIY